ncbi:MAG: hypothetical protein ACUVUD_01170 [bacterium]
MRVLSFFTLGVIFIVAGCVQRVAKPAVIETGSVFVSGDLNSAELVTLARLVGQTKSARPCLWLFAGEIFDEKVELLSDGECTVDLLSSVGVDAVLISQGWLKFGVDRLKQLVDRARFRVLGYNLTDTFDLPVAHPWMIKKLAGIDLAIGGLFFDSTSLFLNQKGVKFTSPQYAGQKLLILLKGKGDVTALISSDYTAVPGFDLIFNAGVGKTVRYDFAVVNGKVRDVKKEVVCLEDVEAEPRLVRLVDSLRLAMDSLGALPVVETKVKIPPRALTRAIVEGYLERREVDGFIYDSSNFVRENINPGTITVIELIRVLVEPGNLVLVNLEGEEIARLLKRNKNLLIEMRTGIRGRRIMAHKSYRIATTPAIVMANPELKAKKIELSVRQLWKYGAEILQAQGSR